MKEEIKVSDLSKGLLYLKKKEITDKNIANEINIISQKIKKNSYLVRKEVKALYLPKDTVEALLKSSMGKYSHIKETSWDDLLDAIERGKEEFSAKKEELKLENANDVYSYWYMRLKEKATKAIKRGDSIKGILQAYYGKLLVEVKEIKSPATAIFVIMSHRKYLKELIKTADKLGSKSLKLKLNLSEWNKYSVDAEEALAYFGVPDWLVLVSQDSQGKSLEESLEERQDYPYTLSEFYSKLDQLFKSEELKNRILGVLLATGRRSVEVMEKSTFRLSKRIDILDSKFPFLTNETGFSVKNLAKKRGSVVEGTFPCLYNPKRVIETIAEARKEKTLKTHLSPWMKRHHPELAKYTPHDLRGMYNTYSYWTYNPEGRLYEPIWGRRVLGHADNNRESVDSYMVGILPKE